MKSGKNGVVKMGGTIVSSLTGWTLSESSDTVTETEAGEDWKATEATYKGWSGEITMNWRINTANGHDLRAGATVAVELYADDDDSGKTYYSGNVVLGEMSVGVPHDGLKTRSYSYTGDGALSEAVVA